MGKNFQYSVIIRTLGAGGEKYKRLIESIRSQSLKPNNIYVFIADGYPYPKERLGYEKFIFCKKGMWHQRIFGLEYVANNDSADFILASDDDMELEKDFSLKSMEILEETHADILAPSILCPKQEKLEVIQPWSKKDFLNHILGTRVERRDIKYRIAINSTGGYDANTNLATPTYPTQSVAGGAIWIRNSRTKKLRLRDELWLDATRYPLPEDQVFGYKAFINGLAVMGSRNLLVRHLDSGGINPTRGYDIAFSSGRNFLIFWHRFLWTQASKKFRKVRLLCGIFHHLIGHAILYFLISCSKMRFSLIYGFLRGVASGVSFIKSKEYKILPSPIENN